MIDRVSSHKLSADSHLLALLGDELIGNERLAVFELVKNAYDADATAVSVTLEIDGSAPRLVVQDDGTGMSPEVIVGSWLRLGTNHKRARRERTTKFGRMPLGEKGVGRFAVQKLGAHLEVVTRSLGLPEVVVEIGWKSLLDSSSNLGDLAVSVRERSSPELFVDDATGTRLTITGLRRVSWTRGDLRSLKRMLVSLMSPFSTANDFHVALTIPGREADIHDVLDSQDILRRALWTYRFEIDVDAAFTWRYRFSPPTLIASRLGPRDLTSQPMERLEVLRLRGQDLVVREQILAEKQLLQSLDLTGIGPIRGVLYVFDRRRELLSEGTLQQIRQYLDEQTGVRIYRDGVRVFNYGEGDDDWLALNASRINRPASRMGTKSVIGSVELDLSQSTGLREKTNREGFDENNTYKRLRWTVQSVVSHFDRLRHRDRENLETLLRSGSLESKARKQPSFATTMAELRALAEKKHVASDLGAYLDSIEREYRQMEGVLSSSGSTGLTLALVFHEVEREVRALGDAIGRGDTKDALVQRSSYLVGLLEGFAPLLKQTQRKSIPVRQILERVRALNQGRLDHHGVIFSCPVLTGEEEGFDLSGPTNLYLATLNNLLDNAIHWARLRVALENSGEKPAISIRTFANLFDDSNAVVVADNGPGFRIDPDDARRAFVTTKPGGMGLGLYYASLVMESTGGDLVISTPAEFGFSPALDGAAVCLRFKRF